jgi:hypothetical protein
MHYSCGANRSGRGARYFENIILDTVSRPIPSRLTGKIAHASIEYDENKSYVRNQA